jgi:hypothetical protein
VAFLKAKRDRLTEPHMRPLAECTQQVRDETGGEVRDFAPDSGGVHARALFLYEAPGARSTNPTGPRKKASGSGLISPTTTTRRPRTPGGLYQDADLPREQTLVWNIVPWYIGSTSKIRSATNDDLIDAQPYVDRLIRLPPHVQVVVALGDKARDRWLRYLLRPDAPLLPTLACPHPSPQVLNIPPQQRDVILAALQRVTHCSPTVQAGSEDRCLELLPEVRPQPAAPPRPQPRPRRRQRVPAPPQPADQSDRTNAHRADAARVSRQS